MKKIFCKIGWHKWNRPVKTSHGFSSSIYDVKKTCRNCGKSKKWVEIKK